MSQPFAQRWLALVPDRKTGFGSIAALRQVLIGASWYFGEKFLRMIGAFLIGAWVARYLGPEGYGALAYALALVAVLGFAGSLGIESLVVRDLVEGNRDPQRLLSTYLFIRFLGALVVPILGFGYLLVTHPDDIPLMWMTFFCSFSVLFGALDTADIWLQSRQQARVTSSIRIVGFAVGAAGRIALILSGASLLWFAAVVIAETGVIAALYYRVLSRNALAPRLQAISMAEARHLLVAGRMMIFSGLTVSIYSKVDILFVGALLSRDAVGTYAIAATMVAAWNMIGMSIVQAWAPTISAACVNSRKAYITSLRQLLTVALAISAAGSLVLYLAADVIFLVLLGPSYGAGAEVFRILIWSSIPVYIGVATSQIIVNERIYWVSTLRTATALVFSVLCMYAAASGWTGADFAGLMVVTSALATAALAFSGSARKTIKELAMGVI